jgi:hypothetical protein
MYVSSMKTLLAALAFVVFTFPLAFFWHLKFFRTQYERWQYFGGDAQPLLGLLAMLVQGVLLAVTYPFFSVTSEPFLNALAFSGFMLIFMWSTHVVSTMAKTKETRNGGFFALETLYLVIQFGVFGVLLGLVQTW